jgi:predicted membrane protein
MIAYNILTLALAILLIFFVFYCFYKNYHINERKTINSENVSLWRKIFLPPE